MPDNLGDPITFNIYRQHENQDKAKLLVGYFLDPAEAASENNTDAPVVSVQLSKPKEVQRNSLGEVLVLTGEKIEALLNLKESRELGALLLGIGLDPENPEEMLESLREEPEEEGGGNHFSEYGYDLFRHPYSNSAYERSEINANELSLGASLVRLSNRYYTKSISIYHAHEECVMQEIGAQTLVSKSLLSVPGNEIAQTLTITSPPKITHDGYQYYLNLDIEIKSEAKNCLPGTHNFKAKTAMAHPVSVSGFIKNLEQKMTTGLLNISSLDVELATLTEWTQMP